MKNITLFILILFTSCSVLLREAPEIAEISEKIIEEEIQELNEKKQV